MANIKDIARHAGVSVATVSRALSTPSLVRPRTIERIEAAIVDLNYEPNHLAAGLRRQRSDNVIVAVPSIYNPFTSAFVQGIENVARANRMRVLLGITEGDVETLNKYTAMIAGKQADGMILLENSLPDVVRRPPAGGKVPPLVAACEYPPDLQLPRVRIDNHEAAALVVSHLAELGHRRIATITGPLAQFMSKDRLAGYRLGLARNRLEFDAALVAEGDFSLQSGHDAMVSLLENGDEFTAVACANDEMALGALSALQQRGIAVPDEMSVVGFDDLRFGAFASPPLTTIHIPTIELGEAAMRLMLDSLLPAEEQPPAREVVLPHRLIVRQSTAAPRRRRRKS
ncbi:MULTISPECIES: LacI family DNA-binding transcriptional regulator [unclassified Novosphingobium]|uniref:LacI family DNA-binding transcriptional regulator n=1 Tax=Novosphingobium TaxID=165696 RepID=UPI001445B073|nr:MULTISPECIES: LacI family DNA-binding transcriptional regulator [unclassified Novosphingobium]NKJ44085.1 LacI family repressor for deo operon, udp, cdd, tsx, nupC, and nupG [Novosphingobium sp. SG720]NMN05425.1 LacI family repressor for deo operon, udp, cdd, tsx, nupC, and nupG [Novosphingobium sp. SG919]NMN87720.1 LacI family repressor for deo operon, udp, cdd, tsx, nupC, and nupG [Novosphingobium sp. SG916]